MFGFKNSFVKQNFGSEKYFDPKNNGTEKILGQHLFNPANLMLKTFWSEKFYSRPVPNLSLLDMSQHDLTFPKTT